MEKTCAQCGIQFHSRASRTKYCSQACYHKSKENPDARYHPQQRTCQVCGKEFTFKWQGTTAHKGLYCSRDCSSIGRKGQVPDQLGEKHWNWKGGRHLRKRDGYVVVQLRDENGARPWQLEHRLVMAEHLGRPLLPTETVHHINGDKADNRIENLEVWNSRHPRGQRVQDLVAFAKEILELYG
jgi:hypothetical protein